MMKNRWKIQWIFAKINGRFRYGCIFPLSSGSIQSSPEEDGIRDLEWQDLRLGLTGQAHPLLAHPIYSIVNNWPRDKGNHKKKWYQNETSWRLIEKEYKDEKKGKKLSKQNSHYIQPTLKAMGMKLICLRITKEFVAYF